MPATNRKGSAGGGLLDALDERARPKAVDNFSSIDTYYRSAKLWLRQAELYRQRHNDTELYVMLMRFASLVAETIPKHRAFSKNDPKYLQLHRDCLRYMDELERLRASLKLTEVLRELAGPEGEEAIYRPTKVAGTVLLSAGNVPEIRWEALAAPPPPSAGAALGVPQPEGFDLLAGLGLGTAATAMSSSWAAPSAPPLLPQQQQPQQPPFPDLPELSPSIRLPAASHATLAKHALLPASYGGSAAYAAQQQRTRQQSVAPQPPRTLYPELAALEPPPPEPAVEAALAGLDVNGWQQGSAPPPPPSPYNELGLGPQEVGVISAPRPTQPLPPDATCCAPGAGAVVPAPPPTGVQELKRLQTMRDVHVSVALMDEFMRYAISNTRRGIETCGILAGTLSADDAVFTITTLIVPKQTGTTDTVEMLGEEEIFEVQDSRALYPLGWIHTHPTQTCFLSSVDIHTHCGFQTMLDEAVAIVMAPKDPSKRVGIFRLSTPGGVKLVQGCPLRGFHAHPPTDSGQPIYELCGHVYLNPRAAYEVVDLR